jgi:carboxyl-terminal processing protease
MKQLIKAALAEQLFGTNAAEEIMNVNDEMILEVIKLSSDKKEEVAEVVKTKKKS